MSELKNYLNDIKNGKRIFEIFDNVEKALTTMLEHEAKAGDLDTIIARRTEELKKLDIEYGEALENVEKARDDVVFLKNKAKEDAAEIVAVANKDAKRITDDAEGKVTKAKSTLANLEDKIADSKLDLKAINEDMAEAQSRLDALNEQIAKTKEQAKAILNS